MTTTFDFAGDDLQSAAATLLRSESAGVAFPEPVRAAILAVETAFNGTRAIDREVHSTTAQAEERLEAEITAQVVAAAGRGELLEDPFAPVRELKVRRGSFPSEAAALRTAWRRWSAEFRVQIIENAGAIADQLEAAIATVIDEAAPAVAELEGVPFTNVEYLLAAPAAVRDAFEAARPLAERQDMLRKAAWALWRLNRPGNGETRPNAREEWIALARRFAGAGFVLDEAFSYATPDAETGEKDVLARSFGDASWRPAGHAVQRLIEASRARPAVPAGPAGL